jgi:Na+/H+-dicarboxylate symporter
MSDVKLDAQVDNPEQNQPEKKSKSKQLTNLILLGMVLGIVVGYILNTSLPLEEAKKYAGYISLVTDVFLRLIKMLIAPLVFSTLVVGVAHMGDAKSIGRIGVKTMGWFLAASFVSLLLGLIMVNILQPGHNLNLPIPDVDASNGLKVAALNIKDFITHLVPKSVVEAMAMNEILQIVVFSIFFGVGLASMGKNANTITSVIEELSHVMLKITGYVMNMAPLAVFAAMASTITTQGIGVLATYAKFMGGFYLSLSMLWLVLIFAGFLFLGKSIGYLLQLIKEPILLAFSTASSESAYPKTMERLQQFGISKKVTSFVLPMGYSFNLDGSMMYCTFATLFIAQVYNIPLSLNQQITILLLLMVTSKGMAGIPRASLVVISATLAQFNIPEAGLLLIMGIDQFLDMGRSATNVVGNSIATAVVAKFEGELKVAEPQKKPSTMSDELESMKRRLMLLELENSILKKDAEDHVSRL